jgi:hypothetical protein
MNFLSRLSGWFGRGGTSDLQENMDKAMATKQQEAATGANIPPHQTAHHGMQPANDPHSDARRGTEAGFTPQFKRSHVARSGDT